MINILKQGSSLLITSDNNQFPWKDGKMSVPLNSIAYIIDESDYVTFRSVANNDILFTSLIGELKINDESVSKDDLITMFDSVANSSGSAGEGGTDGVNSINGYQGDVRIKTVNGTSLIGSGDITIEGGSTDLSDYYTKQETNSLIPSTYVSRIEDFNLYTKDAPYKKIQLQYVNSDSETIITKEIILEWSGTQSEYDVLGTYDDNITYNIIEG
jgi:hypothetical protein